MTFNISKTKYNDLLKSISKFKKNDDYEFELRLMNSIYNINHDNFKTILNKLVGKKVKGGEEFKYEINSFLDIITDNNTRFTITGLDNIKKYWLLNDITKIPHDIIKKTRLSNIDINNYGIRFSLSDEKKLTGKVKPTNISTYRFKNRYIIYSNDNICRYDLTVTKTSDSMDNIFKNSQIENKIEDYEIEIEVLKNKDVLKLKSNEIFDSIIKNIYFIISILQNNNNIINISTKNKILNEYKTLVKARGNKLEFIAANPVTLHLDNIQKSDKFNILKDYAVTLKADGVRNFLYISKTGDMYLFNNNFNILDINTKSPLWKNSLFECEYIENTNDIYIYDMLFSKGTDLRKRHLKSAKKSKLPGRIDIAINFLKSVPKKESKYKILIKKYSFSNKDGDIFQKSKELWCNRKQNNFYSDGLIFTPIKEHYPMKSISWHSLFKWKPPSLNSIDFLIKIVKDEDGKEEINSFIKEKKGSDGKITRIFKKYKTIELYVGGYKDIVNNYGKKSRPYGPVIFNPFKDDENINGYVKLFIDVDDNMKTKDPLSKEIDIIKDDTIVEFSYDVNEKDGFKWKPMRVRYDKTTKYKKGNRVYGNNEKIALDIFMTYQVPILEDVIISGEISNDLIEKQKKIRQELTSNIVNKSANNYYTTDTTQNSHIRQKYQSFHNVIIKDSLYKQSKQLLKDRVDIDSQLNLKLLEFASGRGADLNRWKKYNFAKVIGIEPVMSSIEVARERFQKLDRPKPETYFLRGDLSKLIFPNYDAGSDKSNKINLQKFIPTKYQYDIVSIQFALHYFFENEISVRTIMQNINDNLSTGGLVIGTCFDGERVVSKLKGKSKLEGKNDKGDILWSITKDYKIRKLANTKSSLGKHINIFVKSIGQEIKEPIVNYNYLDKLFTEYGFNKISVESFESIYDKNKFELSEVEKQFSFMNNAFIYQKVKNTPDKLYTKLIKLMDKNLINK